MTSKENIALNFIFAWLNESRYNRTHAEYLEIASRIPKLDALHAYVNGRLADWAKAGFAPYQICYFRAGDRSHWYEPFPTSLSKSTIRNALIKSGFWQLMHSPVNH